MSCFALKIAREEKNSSGKNSSAEKALRTRHTTKNILFQTWKVILLAADKLAPFYGQSAISRHSKELDG
jgi:hypothetical protein